MNFSFGGGKHRLGLVVIAALFMASAGCSSDDPSPLDAKATPSPTADAKNAADQKDVVDVYQRYWAAKKVTENKADPDPKRFKGIADGPFIELYLKQVRDASEAGITRKGAPKVGDYEPTVKGDTATVLACLDEREWKMLGNGKPIETPPLKPEPVGATLEKRADGWVMTDLLATDDLTKACA